MNLNEKRKGAATNCNNRIKSNLRINKYKIKRTTENIRIAWYIWKIGKIVGSRRRNNRKRFVRKEINILIRVKRITKERKGFW